MQYIVERSNFEIEMFKADSSLLCLFNMLEMLSLLLIYVWVDESSEIKVDMYKRFQLIIVLLAALSAGAKTYFHVNFLTLIWNIFQVWNVDTEVDEGFYGSYLFEYRLYPKWGFSSHSGHAIWLLLIYTILWYSYPMIP